MADTIEELRKEVTESQSFDVDSFKFPPNVPLALQEEIKNDFKLSKEVQRLLLDYAERMTNGETVTWEDLQNAVNQFVLERKGTEYGMPLPSLYEMSRPMVLAKGVPLRHVVEVQVRTELEEEIRGKVHVRNSWSKLGDMEVAVIDDPDGGPFAFPRYHAGKRLRKLLDTALMRSGTSQTAEAEMKALESLKKRINKRQWESYVLSGIFPEHSEKSGLHYFFRKGYPTIAASYRAGIKSGSEGGRILACLCLHPIGYFQGTYCGMMCPTDEVICHLLMMRADEHCFWKRCGQWSAEDPRSGI